MEDLVLRMKTLPDLTNEKAWEVVTEGAREIERLRKIEAAARNLIDNSPIGEDDKPYCSDVSQAEFKALAAIL